MLKINKKITPYNFTNADDPSRVQYIVIHYTASTGSAKNNASYFARSYVGSSAHYFVDSSSIWQSVEDADIAWHCGLKSGRYKHPYCRNKNSIGIEMCGIKDSNGVWYFDEKTVKNTVELTISLMQKYNVSVDRVIRHYDVTGKNCPEPYVRDVAAWNDFKNKILNNEEELDMAVVDELRAELKVLTDEIMTLKDKMLSNHKTYNWISECPSWSVKTIEKLHNKGYLKGDETGALGLTMDTIKILVIMDRTGAFDVDNEVYMTIDEVPEWGQETIKNLIDEGVLKGDGTGLNLSLSDIRILVVLDRANNLK